MNCGYRGLIDVQTSPSYTAGKRLARVAGNEFYIVNFSVPHPPKSCVFDTYSQKITRFDYREEGAFTLPQSPLCGGAGE